MYFFRETLWRHTQEPLYPGQYNAFLFYYNISLYVANIFTCSSYTAPAHILDVFNATPASAFSSPELVVPYRCRFGGRDSSGPDPARIDTTVA
jgi:hypothetical protein